jgi:hypothetical protein
MNPKILPTGPEECEHKAGLEAEPKAGTLREKALVLREWIAALKTGTWTS